MEIILSIWFKFLSKLILKIEKTLLITSFFFILLGLSNTVKAQTIPGTGSITTPCGDCTPTSWFDFEPGSTPDISNSDHAGGQGTLGGLATWFASPLPPPPTGATSWITMKDLGNYPGTSEESVSTTMAGIVSGKIYRLTIYTMGAISNENGDAALTAIPGDVGTGAEYYGGTYKTKFNYQIGKNSGDLQPEQVVSGVTQNVWGKSFFYFAGDPEADGTMHLNILTGEYSQWDGTNRELIEPLHIAVELNAIEELDSDGDGIPDSNDIDDDNDGILDTDELTVGGILYDPLGDDDGDLLPNYLDVRDDGGTGTGGNTAYDDLNADGIPDIFDFDRDGIPNHLDLDADNDGIPDIIEGQPTATYLTPTGVVGANGLDSAFENNDTLGATSYTITNTDGIDSPDYLDLDSDNDGTNDDIEANSITTYEVGVNGLDNVYDNGDNYTDTNGNFDNTQTDNFPDTTVGGDVNWRDTATTVGKDTDGDGILDITDIDDDNDGIPDVDECSTLATTATSNATGVFSETSITNSSNSFNGNSLNFAVLDAETDVLILDLDNPDAIPNNTLIYIQSSITTNVNHTMRVEQSANGTDFSNQKVFTWASTGSTEDKEYRLDADANYIRIKLDVEDSGELRIHNVSFDGFETVCDFDNDGIPNHLDLDSDNDGIPDNIEAQSTTGYEAPSGVDTNNDGLDDAYDPGCTPCGAITGVDLSSPNNHDGIDNPDYLDLDSDNDGTSDRIEANLSLNSNYGANGLDVNYDNGDNYVDVNGNFDDTPFGEFPDNPSGGEIDWRDNTSIFTDNDNDGVPDATDFDDDNDGILDTVESGGFDPSADADSDGIPNYKDADFSTGVGGDTINTFGVWTSIDSDNDGVPNHFDLDSDNDGIPDNVEGQLTNGYEIPDGIVDGDGVDTAYTGGKTPVDTDSDGTPDYLELDSDNDGVLDNTEAGLVLSGEVGVNGLDNNYDNGDNYVDVNGSFDGSQTDNFPDIDSDVYSGGDVDYRDDTFTIDTDGDGVNDEIDLDDDNDGILDSVEQSTDGVCVGADKTLDWGDSNEFDSNAAFGVDPTIVNGGITTESKVEIALTRKTTVGSNSSYLIGNSAVSNNTDAYVFTQRAGSAAISRHFFTFKAPVKDLGFTIYDIDEDNGAGGTSKDKIEIIITKQDGSSYTLVSGTDYPTPDPDITDLGSNTFEANNGDSNEDLVISQIPVYITKIQIVFTNTGSGSISDDHNLAIGNFTYCSPLDSDGDGIFDYIDLDADNDGIPDNIEAQSTENYIPPSGSYGVTGIDLAYSTGLTVVNTDGDSLPDYLDLDSDGDLTNDIDEGVINEALPANAGGMFTGEVGKNGLIDALEDSDTDQGYTDVNGVHVNPNTDGFLDDSLDSDVLIGGDLDYRDTLNGVDTDDDGFVNSTDIDDDGDGIPDINESGGNDPDGDEDNDGILNYKDTSDDGSGGPGGSTDYTDTDGNGIPDVYDFDGDGVPNHLDIDADNDGIPDNIEAQTTALYAVPSGVDTNNDGLDDAYDPNCTPCGGITGVDLSTPNNHDGIDNPDYIDTDSDNDGLLDIAENNTSNGSDVPLDEHTGISTDGTPDGIIDPSNFIDTDGDGLADIFEGSNLDDGYDVNDEIDNPATDLPDIDSGGLDDDNDVDFRDIDDDGVTIGAAGNILWLRADKDVTEASDEVTSWVDQTASAHDATSVTGEAPDRIEIGINFNPVIDFDGSNQDLIIGVHNTSGGILGGATYNNLWSYVVYNPNVLQNSFIFVENVNGGNYHNKLNSATVLRQRMRASSTQHEVDPTGYDNNYSLFTFGTTTAIGTGNTPTGFQQAIHKEGLVLNSRNPGTAIVSATGINREMDIGSNGNNRYLDGQIAEIMIFNETPTALKQQQVESYLAIKYGFTLSSVSYSGDIVEGDYVLADQTTKVWDYTANSAYHFDVAGIGRDDAMDFAQYQSKSVGVSSDAIITIGLTAIADSNLNNVSIGTADDFENNKDFLMWGNDDGSVLIGDVTETELICAPEKTLARTWKIVETGSVGSVEITATKSILDAALATPSTIKVLKVADDEAFTTNVHYAPLVEDGTVYTTNFDFNGTKYFTYAEVNGIFWYGGATLEADRWIGGDNSGKPTINPADKDKVMVIDAQGTDNHPTLIANAIVECVWIKNDSKLMVEDDKYLEFDEDFILDGEIRLIGDGQLIQTHIGLSNVQGNGSLYKDQQAIVPNVYRYHYWSSPVRELNLDTYRVGQVLKDGTIATSSTSNPLDINFIDNSYDGAIGDYVTDPLIPIPITIANYWIYTNLNDPGDGTGWTRQRETGVIQRGQGYSMKSTGASPQNFTFVGTPNDGSITIPITANTTSLIGNPYPSSLDITDFINTNTDAIDGTVYFWEHTGEDANTIGSEGHNFSGYQGGYSQRNIAMGIAANNVESEDLFTFDWEDAIDNGASVSQNVTDVENDIDVTAIVTFSEGNAEINDALGEGGSSGEVVITTAPTGIYTVTIDLDENIDPRSIFLYNDVGGVGTVDVTISTPNGSDNDDVTQTLIGNTGQAFSLFWSDVKKIIISSDDAFNIVLDDLIFTKGGEITFGQGTYHAPNRYMSVAQGFFVSASETGGTIRFENSQRNFKNDDFGTGGTYFFRNGENKNPEEEQDLLPIIKLGLGYYNGNNVPLHRQIGISFRTGNNFEYNNGYDSEAFDINSTDIYWNFPEYSDKKLIIAGVGPINNQLEVPLTIEIDTNDKIELMIDEQKNINHSIYILDKLTHTYYNLEDKIELDLEKGLYTDRFYLTFIQNVLNVEEENPLNKELNVYMDNNAEEIVIKNNNNLNIIKVELFNILGQKVKSWKNIENNTESRLKTNNVATTFYIVKIQTTEGNISKKIMIE